MDAPGCTPSLDGLLSYEQAVERLLGAAEPVVEIELVSLHEALGRVLAAPVVSDLDVPGWDNSGMDGYALRAADVTAPAVRLAVSQRIPAGAVAQPLQPGTAARIFTGAPIPEGADAVVMQEACTADDAGVTIDAVVRPGDNIRRRGEDIAAHAEIVPIGTRLQPQHIGLAASVGVAELAVYRRLKVALFTSGDELVMPGEPLRPGAIYNSNLFTAGGLLHALGCEVLDLGIVEDSLEATMDALRRGAAQADMVIASGGVSVGEEDHVKPAVQHLGTLDLWRIAIRPGKPVAFGHIGATPFLGTQGNPVSLFVTFLLFARPFLLKRMGAVDWLPKALQVTAGFDWPRPDKRREFHRARLEHDQEGRLVARVYPSRSSGVLSSVAWADGLVIIPEGRTVKHGDALEYLSFAELIA
jgi:molybdopterin molybdotransferase